ncbi:hypothetical protein ACFUJR_15045 [Streptomyces sp. NPDC057271]|uniref:hypothetical protein n=1 Tax=unclassified Streptomyces TaxID=2593676 RepID=UPI003631F8F1
MDTERVRYDAYFTNPDDDEDELIFPVASWDRNGMALILDEEGGQLVVAKELEGFLRVERYEVPQVRAVLPGGNWRLRKKDGIPGGHQVVAFLVYDGFVRPVSSLPSANRGWPISAATHQLYEKD